MVDFASKIKAQKAKDRERAKKKRQSVRGDRPGRPDKAPIPRRRKKEDTSDALIKGITDLFKDDGPTGSEVQSLEDYITGYGNPIGAGPASVGYGGAGYSVFKKGGRLKKAGKRKRAALRGQRSELRGS